MRAADDSADPGARGGVSPRTSSAGFGASGSGSASASASASARSSASATAAAPAARSGGSNRWLLLSFAGLGATAATIPAAIPAMAETFSVSVSALTPAVPAVFFGLLGGVLVAPVIGMRLPAAATVRVGGILQAVGLVIIAVSPSPFWFVFGAAVAGLGFGLVEVAGTASTRASGKQAAPRLLVRLALAVAIVGTVAPVVVLGASSLGWVRLVPVLAAILQLVAAISRRPHRAPIDSAMPDRLPDGVPEGRLSDNAVDNRFSTRTLRRRAAIERPLLLRVSLIAVAIFCYVGVETILSGWSAATIAVELGTDAGVAALGTSAFWLLISLGRFSGAVADRHLTPAVVVLVATGALAAALIGAALTSGIDPVASVVLLSCAVFFAGPCYALLLGLGLGMLPGTRSVSAASTLVALGAAGGAAIPFFATVSLGTAGRSPVLPAAIAAVALVATLTAAQIIGARAGAASVPSGGAG